MFKDEDVMDLSLEVKYSVYFAFLTVALVMLMGIFLRILSVGETIIHSFFISALFMIFIVLVVIIISMANRARFVIWCKNSPHCNIVDEEDE